ncbi:MAG: TIGR04283 family arsenosugar biosynthesis glycosyltransferase [Bacteroidota bacterium]
MINPTETLPLTSLIIPTLNEAEQIAPAIEAALQFKGPCEIIVADGGSEDQTLSICQNYPQVLSLSTAKGRARQMNAAAKSASGDYLFFLHADTRAPNNSLYLIHQVLKQEEVIAGSFYLRFDQLHWTYRLLSQVTRLNVPWMTYGDQGLFMRRSSFEAIGGFSDLPLMEDLEIQHRLRRQGHFVKLAVPVQTSARRFEKNGLIQQLVLDFCLMLGYYMGISPKRLKHWYPDHSPKP